MKKSVVRKSDGVVVNIIEIEDGANWEPPEGCELMDGGEIGDVWDGVKFTKAALPSWPSLQAEWDAAPTLEDKVEVLAKALGIKVE